VGIARDQITGVVLAGGRGQRMGGADKGLELLGGQALALHALERLRPQVGPLMINANRNAERYAAFGVPVWPDSVSGHPGPLAGFLSALEHAETPWLMTVPCDTPAFPADLVERLALALHEQDGSIAMPSCVDTEDGAEPRWRAQPVFCLMRSSLAGDLRHFLHTGGRKIDLWTARHGALVLPFDDPGAFHNINTSAQLQDQQS
jgi:molybdenum cofactor guanylyltransferase